MTQNLWGIRGDWGARRRVLRAGFRRLELDFVAFIEAIKTDEYDKVVDLLGDVHHVAHQAAREPGGQGASIASRWPLGTPYEVDLQVSARVAGFAATTMVVEIDAPEPYAPLVFANHVPSWQLQFEHERELQAVAAARFIEAFVGDREVHVVLAGDFSSDPDAANVRFITGRQSLDGTSVCYRDAWEAVHGGVRWETFSSDNPLLADWDWPFKRLDYVFVRCGEHGGPTLEIRDCELAFNEAREGVGQATTSASSPTLSRRAGRDPTSSDGTLDRE
jgi:endonuclease/exonuclease/phosphatase family metal-dependent hydrolase